MAALPLEGPPGQVAALIGAELEAVIAADRGAATRGYFRSSVDQSGSVLRTLAAIREVTSGPRSRPAFGPAGTVEIVNGYPTPNDAVIAEDSVPPEYVNIVAVDYSPDGTYAVVLVEYNEPPDVEPYVVLCEKTDAGWVEGSGGSAGGVSWMATGHSGSLGVQTTWEPRAVRWDVPAPLGERATGSGRW